MQNWPPRLYLSSGFCSRIGRHLEESEQLIITTESNSHAGNYYTPAVIMKALQEGQPLPAAGSSPEPACDLVIQNLPFGTQSTSAE